MPTARQGLYDPALEKDSCGVGLVANLSGNQRRDVVVDANEMLTRMEHRGGCGCDPTTGDGAGMLLALPREFTARVARDELRISDLPEPGKFGLAQIFVPKSRGNAFGGPAAAENMRE